MLVFINNDFLEESNASLNISDLSIQRGYGVFDFFRTVELTPLFINEHITRLFQSAEALRLNISFSKSELKEIIVQLINKNNTPNSGIKITVTGGYSSDGYSIANPNIIITQQKLSTPATTIAKAVKIITHNYVRELPQIKSINYLMGVYLQKMVNEKKANDVLYVKDGIVTEFPRANFFLVEKNNTIVTSADNILYGITRMKILEWAKKDFNIEVRNIKEEDLASCAEAFMTSTTKRILPITQINETVISNGKVGVVTAALHELFLQHENKIVLSST